MNTRYDNTRAHLLETGQRIIVGKGFASVGLNEILTTAGVPKGSFYHYFESKEQFGQALLQDHFDRYLAEIDELFAREAATGGERLMRFWQRWLDRQTDACTDQKCLVVKLGGEVADLSDAMRVTLRDGADQVIGRLSAAIADGISDGSIPALDARETAQTLYQLWLGASLLGKLDRTRDALNNAMAFTRKLLQC